MKELCGACKKLTESIARERETGLPYCAACAPLTNEELTYILLMSPESPVGPPFREGDVVEARCAGVIYDGVGIVREMDMALAHGGTPVYPTWKVTLTEKAHEKAPDEGWYTENCLQLVRREAEEAVR